MCKTMLTRLYVVVIPVSVVSIPYAQMIQHQLAEADYEVRADLTCVGSLNRRIKNAIITKCNFILVVGMNEAANGTVNVRTRNDIV
ncbi:anticodon binding domain protein [Ancylostoma caninum]|uniref:Anticodon binding domain protein n=1 Tax=Ancylostoma caninum TaxID=29170 RepID=A0A368H4G2_ANCCA|nr:anticodon binding domain protein [Ancylostoma caninum]